LSEEGHILSHSITRYIFICRIEESDEDIEQDDKGEYGPSLRIIQVSSQHVPFALSLETVALT
jgi:hypothetical protein